MCTNYRPSSREAFAAGLPEDIRETKILFKPEVFPNDPAPIIRLDTETDSQRTHLTWTPARFGLVPFWAKPDQLTKLGRMAYNSRTETVSEKPMFRNAWKRRQFCLVPADAFYEPNWETGKAVRWRIEMASREPFAIGGIWDSWGDGESAFSSFSMLTINADTHALMNHFHRPGDEKRMPVIVPRAKYRDWLESDTVGARAFFEHFPVEEMIARADPMASRVKAQLNRITIENPN